MVERKGKQSKGDSDISLVGNAKIRGTKTKIAMVQPLCWYDSLDLEDWNQKMRRDRKLYQDEICGPNGSYTFSPLGGLPSM